MLNANQLVWRCRRGVRELDVLFNRYLTDYYSQLSTGKQEAFQRLLEVQDPIIMDWIIGKTTPEDDGISYIITKLRAMSGIAR